MRYFQSWNMAALMVLVTTAAIAAQESPPVDSAEPQEPAQAEPGQPPAQPEEPEKQPEQTPDESSSERQNGCVTCHGNAELMQGDFKRFFITESDLAGDIHWQKGLRCFDCHGGDPNEVDFGKAHHKDAGYRSVKVPGGIPAFCGHCHSDPQYMRQYSPSPRTDQEAVYWTSGHGIKLKENGDDKVADCATCHGHHNVKAVDDLESPVYATNVAETCGSCHSDQEMMAGRDYNGRPVGHDQVELWSKSVHAESMKGGDTSAPTCNDCHGNHGALPPEVGSVANACGTCHIKMAELFAETVMRHRFEQVDLPGCATCHHHHNVQSPTDEMLGMDTQSACKACHDRGGYGATFLGAQVAVDMRNGLEQLKEEIVNATEQLDHAERLGMEVREARFRLRDANDSLKNARTLIHSFALEPVQEALDAGMAVCAESKQVAQDAVQEYTNRRIWLALSLVPIFIVVGLLLLFIRTLGIPTTG